MRLVLAGAPEGKVELARNLGDTSLTRVSSRQETH
jgi:hypothetical protein